MDVTLQRGTPYIKMRLLTILIILLLVAFFIGTFVSADVISINNIADANTVMPQGDIIEGFFFVTPTSQDNPGSGGGGGSQTTPKPKSKPSPSTKLVCDLVKEYKNETKVKQRLDLEGYEYNETFLEDSVTQCKDQQKSNIFFFFMSIILCLILLTYAFRKQIYEYYSINKHTNHKN